MKYSILILMLCTLTGCAQKRDFLPGVSGEPEPVNTPAMIKELSKNV